MRFNGKLSGFIPRLSEQPQDRCSIQIHAGRILVTLGSGSNTWVDNKMEFRRFCKSLPVLSNFIKLGNCGQGHMQGTACKCDGCREAISVVPFGNLELEIRLDKSWELHDLETASKSHLAKMMSAVPNIKHGPWGIK